MNAMTGGVAIKFGFPVGHIGPDTAQKLFGAYQVQNHLGNAEFGTITLNGRSWGPALYYGEIPYSGYWQQWGIAAGIELRNKR